MTEAQLFSAVASGLLHGRRVPKAQSPQAPWKRPVFHGCFIITVFTVFSGPKRRDPFGYRYVFTKNLAKSPDFWSHFGGSKLNLNQLLQVVGPNY